MRELPVRRILHFREAFVALSRARLDGSPQQPITSGGAKLRCRAFFTTEQQCTETETSESAPTQNQYVGKLRVLGLQSGTYPYVHT